MKGRMVKVSELIEVLKAQNPESRVVVNGYEGGFCDVKMVRELPIKLNEHEESYYGPHEQVDDCEPDETATLIVRIENKSF